MTRQTLRGDGRISAMDCASHPALSIVLVPSRMRPSSTESSAFLKAEMGERPVPVPAHYWPVSIEKGRNNLYFALAPFI